MRSLTAAALAAALAASGCASQSPVTPTPVSTGGGTSSAATIIANAQAAFASACNWLPLAQAAYGIASAFLPGAVTAPANAASAFLTATCANPPTDLVTTIATVQNAVATITGALSTQTVKSARHGAALDDAQTINAAVSQGKLVLQQLQAVTAKGHRHHGR